MSEQIANPEAAALQQILRFAHLMTDSISVDRREMARDILAIARQGGAR